MNNIVFSVSTAFGLEKLLKFEVLDLGFDNLKGSDGRIEFAGSLPDICKLNINLRTANRVFLKLSEFRAETFDELFEGVKKIDWAKYLSRDSEFPVSKVSSFKSKLFAKSSIQAICKKAIVEKLRESFKCNSFPEDGELFKIHIAIKDDIVSVLIDTSGESLNKRAYREKGNFAPIKETLASALVKLATRYPEKDIIYDPLCGTGTILIEGMMQALKIAPGLNRSFISETWNFIDKKYWNIERENARKKIVKNLDIKYFGTDIDEEAVKIAKENAKKAGVYDYIDFEVSDFWDFDLNKIKAKKGYEKYFSRKGIIITNPPYGERLMDKDEVFDLYADMGDKFFEDFPNFDYFVLTSDTNFERAFGERADKNRKLYNGKILCYLYQYFNMKKN
jgi:putative N6-adenine-specific DNA methylase